MSAKSPLTGEARKADIKRRNALAAKKARAKKKAAREAENAAAELAAPKTDEPTERTAVRVAGGHKGRRIAKTMQDSSKTPSMLANERRIAEYKRLKAQYPDNIFHRDKMYTPQEWHERTAKAIAKAEQRREAVAEHNASVHMHNSIARALQQQDEDRRYEAERGVKQRCLVNWIVNTHCQNSRPELEELRVSLQRLKNEGPRAHLYNAAVKQWHEDGLNPDLPLTSPPARMAWQTEITIQTERVKRTVPEWYQWFEEFDYADYPCENYKLYPSRQEREGL